MGREMLFLRMGIDTRETFITDCSMAKGSLRGSMASFMKEILPIIESQAKASINGRMAVHIKEMSKMD